jgi:NitT/TauT family transport system permease protein
MPVAGEVISPIRLPHEAVASLVALAVVWEFISWISPAIGIPAFAVPSLLRVAEAFNAVTVADVLVTLARVLAAMVISFLIGSALAVAMYVSNAFDRYAQPVVRVLMAVPVVSWILFAILWFKWVELRICFVLVVVCAPIFTVNLLDGMRGVSKDLREMLRSFRPTGLQFFRKLILPGVLPAVFTAWKINMSLAIRVVTMAELVGAVTGIGHKLATAQELFSVAEVFAWTLVLVVLLFVLEVAMSLLEDRLLRWRT